jgi:biopolymer transport protein ExbD
MAGKRQQEPGLEPDINQVITPMLDMAFQVLMFFILTFHPSQLEGLMELNLPDAGQAAAPKPEQAQPDKSMLGEPEVAAEITVVLKTRHDGVQDGSVGQILLQERQGAKDMPNKKQGGRDVPDHDALRRYLTEARNGLTNQTDIKIQADSALRYSAIMEIMDVCMRAGFKNIGFSPPPDLATPGT